MWDILLNLPRVTYMCNYTRVMCPVDVMVPVHQGPAAAVLAVLQSFLTSLLTPQTVWLSSAVFVCCTVRIS